LQLLPCDSSTAAHFTTKPVLGNVSLIKTHAPKIVSGGQTGADRAALDWALSKGIECGGWCPKGRKAEDGRIAAKYPLIETPSANYVQRTESNVRDTGGTVILSIEHELTGGSRKTAEFAVKHNKPCLHLYPGPAGCRSSSPGFCC
jgi:hypothetical protein